MEDSKVIFISGGTGVGTSTLATKFVHFVPSAGVLGTDIVREILRGTSYKFTKTNGSEILLKYLQESSYTAWKLIIKANPTQYDVEQGFNKHSELIIQSVIDSALRALYENFTLIIEGVHLTLATVTKELNSRILTDSKYKTINFDNRIFRVLLECSDDSIHKEFIKKGMKYSARRKGKKQVYDDNWESIVRIAEHLKSSSKNNSELVLDSSTMNPDELAYELAKNYYFWVKRQNTLI